MIKGIKGFQLDAFLIAYEGWRRGLTLEWYQDESEECTLHRLNSSTRGKFFSLTLSDKKHYFFRSRGDKVMNRTVDICRDKEDTKALLREKNVPTPLGKEFKLNEEKEILKYANEIGYPIVIKPVTGSMGRGVFSNIRSKEEFKDILKHYKTNLNYKRCLVEKHYNGKEYRVYVVGDEAVSAIYRVPANIIGDGKSSIIQLIEQKNKERKKNPYLASKPIKVDYEVEKKLEDQGLNVQSIPAKNEQIFLRSLSNLSAGGDPIDATDEITDEIKNIAVHALKALPSIPHAGVDIIVDPEDSSKGVVLEINATAEIAFHMFPLAGEPKDVPSKIIDYYFPKTKMSEKSNFYFDYQSIISPLKTWSAESVKVTPPPTGYIYRYKFIIESDSFRRRYLGRLRREALKNKLHGSVKKKNDNKVIINVISNDKSNIDQYSKNFKKIVKNKNKLKVETTQLNNDKDNLIRLGIRVIKKRKKK